MGISLSLVSMAFASYPGPDEDYQDDSDMWNGVRAGAGGAYQSPTTNLYYLVAHESQRWASGVTACSGNLELHWWGGTGGVTDYSQEYSTNDDYNLGGATIWVQWVATTTHSHFYNWLWGGEWERTASAIVSASA